MGGGGSPRVDKKIFILNIINFKKVDKSRGGLEQVDKVFFVKFKQFFLNFCWLFYYIFCSI